MALFTVASGFLAAAAVFALVVLRLAKRGVGQAFQPAGSGDFPVAGTPSRGWKAPPTGRLESLPYQEVLTLAFCAAVILSGLWLKADVRFHHIFQAHSVGEFLTALGANLAWPWIVVPPFAVLNLLPLAALAWFYLKDQERIPGTDSRFEPPNRPLSRLWHPLPLKGERDRERGPSIANAGSWGGIILRRN